MCSLRTKTKQYFTFCRSAAKQGDVRVAVMSNGCICCSSASTGNDLERLIDELSVIASQPVDYIIVETSGLVDPMPLFEMISKLQTRGAGFGLHGVVTMVRAGV